MNQMLGLVNFLNHKAMLNKQITAKNQSQVQRAIDIIHSNELQQKMIHGLSINVKVVYIKRYN